MVNGPIEAALAPLVARIVMGGLSTHIVDGRHAPQASRRRIEARPRRPPFNGEADAATALQYRGLKGVVGAGRDAARGRALEHDGRRCRLGG